MFKVGAGVGSSGQPVVAIINTPEPETCPNCGKPENIKRVCRHCNYEYLEAKRSFWFRFIFAIEAVLGVAFFFWLIVTCFNWLMDGTPLLEVLKSQWQAVTNIK